MRMTNRVICFGEDNDSLHRDSSFLRNMDTRICLGKPGDGEHLQPDWNGSVSGLARPSAKSRKQ